MTRKKQPRHSGGKPGSRKNTPRPISGSSAGPRSGPQNTPKNTPRNAPRNAPGTGGFTIRAARDSVIIWGRHAAEAVLANPDRRITALYLSPDAAEWLDERAVSADLPDAVIIDRARLDQALAETLASEEKAVHQGVVMVARPLTPPSLEDFLETGLGDRPVVILLDQITDSRNIGAIMRSARAFGASALISTERHCPQENAMMLRAASGAAEHIPLIRVTNLARAMESLQDHGFFLAAMTARGDVPITRLAQEDRLGIIMGAEGKGLRRLTLEHSDCHVSIDIDDAAESLNVSNAAAIGLFAAGRRG